MEKLNVIIEKIENEGLTLEELDKIISNDELSEEELKELENKYVKELEEYGFFLEYNEEKDVNEFIEKVVIKYQLVQDTNTGIESYTIESNGNFLELVSMDKIYAYGSIENFIKEEYGNVILKEV